MDTIYQRVSGIIERRKPSPEVTPLVLKEVVDVTLEALEILFRPPSEEEVDASLDRIASADELAYTVAGTAARYIDAINAYIAAPTTPGGLHEVSAAFAALEAAVTRFNEAVAE